MDKLTHEQILSASSYDLDLLVTEHVMGWVAWEERRGEHLYIIFQKQEKKEPYKKLRNWKNELERYRQISFSEIDPMTHIVVGIKDYSTDISETYGMEERILELGKEDDYGFEIYSITRADEMIAERRNLNIFKIAHASPEQRCKAALLAVMGL